MCLNINGVNDLNIPVQFRVLLACAFLLAFQTPESVIREDKCYMNSRYQLHEVMQSVSQCTAQLQYGMHVMCLVYFQNSKIRSTN